MSKTVIKNNGYTIVELLVVIALFTVITTIAARSLALVLKGTRKSEGDIGIRQNLDYVISVMSRHLYNAEEITGVTATRIDYEDQWGARGKYFECYDASPTSTSGRIASSSAELFITSLKEVYVTSCNFSCDTAGVPHSCDLNITGNSTNSASPVTVSTRVVLRNY